MRAAKALFRLSWPQGNKTRVHSQTQNKGQGLAAGVRKQPIIALYFESETGLSLLNNAISTKILCADTHLDIL